MPIKVVFPLIGAGGAYPFVTGYADVDAVAANINAGTWDPTSPAAAPSVAQVTNWLCEGTSLIDIAMMTRGYLIPLTPLSSYVPPLLPTPMNGMHPNLYLLLQHAVTAFVCSKIESSRHGSVGEQADQQAEYWHAIWDDYVTRIETGADNLTAWGAEGPFPPEIDPAQAIQSGNLGAMISTDASPSPNVQGALFTRATMQDV